MFVLGFVNVEVVQLQMLDDSFLLLPLFLGYFELSPSIKVVVSLVQRLKASFGKLTLG